MSETVRVEQEDDERGLEAAKAEVLRAEHQADQFRAERDAALVRVRELELELQQARKAERLAAHRTREAPPEDEASALSISPRVGGLNDKSCS